MLAQGQGHTGRSNVGACVLCLLQILHSLKDFQETLLKYSAHEDDVQKARVSHFSSRIGST